jgi:hypothetical protein
MGKVAVGKVKERGNRMSRTVRWLAAALCAVGLVQAAEAGFGIGGKLWMIGFDKSTGLDDTIMFGPKAEWDGETFWLSGMFLFGSAKSEYTEEYGGYTYTYKETMDLQDGEVVFGASFSFIDIGVGLRNTTWSFKEEDGTKYDSLTIWGPMVYIGAGSSFGESPLGWYAGVSYMFLDLGDLTDETDEDGRSIDTGEHYNVELGLSLALDRFSATAGYRQKTFLNYDGDKDTLDLTQKGVAISASFNF